MPLEERVMALSCINLEVGSRSYTGLCRFYRVIQGLG